MPEGPDALSVAFRAASFVLLLNAAGIPIFIAVFGHLIPDSLAAIAKIGWRLAIAALVFGKLVMPGDIKLYRIMRYQGRL